jgi:NitT/TauT family transport system ATP-binding protein
MHGTPLEVLAAGRAHAMAEVDPMLSFEHVTKVFTGRGHDVVAVRDVNLEVASGEIITLVGPSGSGKSTLLNMIAGLMEPTKGSIRYNGKSVTGIHDDVGYMTQNDHLLPWRTIATNIEVPLEIRSVAKRERIRRSAELIDLVGLTGFENAYPTQVSGGMRKRAALARVLAYDPKTLLMDEPFGALDAQLRLRLQSEFIQLCHKLNKTVLFVTHDLEEAIALADRCAVFSARPGTIVKIVDITLPRNRQLEEIRFDPEFLRLSKSLWDILSSSQRDPASNRSQKQAS